MWTGAVRAAGVFFLLSLAFLHEAAEHERPIACADLAALYRARNVDWVGPYPQEAVYDGVGDPNNAASFACKKLD